MKLGKFGNIRKIVLLAIIAVMAISLAACGKSGDGDKKSLKIGYLAVMDDAQAMLAYDAGYYEKHGLDVDLVLFQSGTDLIKGIVQGELDAGVLGFTNALSWGSKGAGLKVVSGAQMGFHSILVRENSGIETVADLKGKSLASQKQGSTADVVLNGVTLKDAGLTRDDVQMQYVSPATAIQTLAAGQVDAAFVFEPFDRIARLTSDVKQIYEIGNVWPFPCMVVITSDKVLDKDRDAVNRMLDAQKEAIELMHSDPDKAAEFITHRFIQEEQLETKNGPVKSSEVIRDAITSQVFHWELDEDHIATMQELADIMVEQGALEEKIDVNDMLDLTWQKNLK